MRRSRKDNHREPFGTILDPELRDQLRHLKIDQKKEMYELVEEAVRDLLLKYGDRAKKKRINK